MSRVARIIAAVIGDATDEQIVAALSELTREELAKLREYGAMVQELAREGLDDLALPPGKEPDWKVRRDGFRVIENEGPIADVDRVAGMQIDREDLPAFLRAFGLDKIDGPDGERYRLIAEQPNEFLEQIQFVEVADAECEYLPGEGRDPGDESDCCKW